MDTHFVVRKETIQETLQFRASPGKNPLPPMAALAAEHSLPFNILEDCDVTNLAEIHKKEGDLWLCLQGEASFTCGGRLVDPSTVEDPNGLPNTNELRAASIEGGEELTLRPGDWCWIPPGVPHQHRCQGVTRLLIVKVPMTVSTDGTC